MNIIDIDDYDYEDDDDCVEMPTPCQKCGDIFDLTEGYGSEKWYPGTVICKRCHRKEEQEIEREEEIENLRDTISNAEYDIKQAEARLIEMGEEVAFVVAGEDFRWKKVSTNGYILTEVNPSPTR